MMVKYRTKPIVVEAERWCCTSSTPGVELTGSVGAWLGITRGPDGSVIQVREGDWLVREPGVKDGYSVLQPATFQMTYERVNTTRRLSVPAQWATDHPQAVRYLSEHLAPITVDTNTVSSMATLWIGEELIDVWNLDGFADDDAVKVAADAKIEMREPNKEQP